MEITPDILLRLLHVGLCITKLAGIRIYLEIPLNILYIVYYLTHKTKQNEQEYITIASHLIFKIIMLTGWSQEYPAICEIMPLVTLLSTLFIQKGTVGWTTYRWKEGMRPRYESNSDCPVCYESIVCGSEVLETQCKHLFHRECVEVWMQQNKSCAMCHAHVD